MNNRYPSKRDIVQKIVSSLHSTRSQDIERYKRLRDPNELWKLSEIGSQMVPSSVPLNITQQNIQEALIEQYGRPDESQNDTCIQQLPVIDASGNRLGFYDQDTSGKIHLVSPDNPLSIESWSYCSHAPELSKRTTDNCVYLSTDELQTPQTGSRSVCQKCLSNITTE